MTVYALIRRIWLARGVSHEPVVALCCSPEAAREGMKKDIGEHPERKEKDYWVEPYQLHLPRDPRGRPQGVLDSDGVPYLRMPVDWPMLVRQKECLAELRQDPAQYRYVEHLEGLLGLLDHVQDEAAKVLGGATVFGPDGSGRED